MKQPNFITIEDGIQPVFVSGGFGIAEIRQGVIIARFGLKVYKTYTGALKAANKIGGVK
jgi:hypothetical protein